MCVCVCVCVSMCVCVCVQNMHEWRSLTLIICSEQDNVFFSFPKAFNRFIIKCIHDEIDDILQIIQK